MKLFAFEDQHLTENFFFEYGNGYTRVTGDLQNARRCMEMVGIEKGLPPSAWEVEPIVVLRAQRLNYSGDWFQFLDAIDNFHLIEMPQDDRTRTILVFVAKGGDGSLLGEVNTMEEARALSEGYVFEEFSLKDEVV